MTNTAIASVGQTGRDRAIVMGAKASRLRGGKLVLLAPAANVEQVLTIAGIDTLVPIYHDIDAAILAVTG